MVPPERLKPTALYLKTSTLPLVDFTGNYIFLKATFISACLLAIGKFNNVLSLNLYKIYAVYIRIL